MKPASAALKGRTLTFAVLVAASACGCATPSLGAPKNARRVPPAEAPPPHRSWLQDAIREVRGGDRQSTLPAVARYQADDGGLFVLDRSAHVALLKFDDSPEVWVLWPSHGPRGDTIYKNDMGEPVLRATRLGGMTVFTARQPGGSAAAVAGVTYPLRIAPLGPAGLYQRLFQASVRCTRAAQHLISFDALDANAGSDALIADAAVVTVGAVVNIAARADGKAVLARVSKVAFAEGGRPEAELRAGVLTVRVTPSQGLAGRPSSERIMWALGAREPVIEVVGIK